MNGQIGNRAEWEGARLKLLNEGIDSYLDAMVAIREFRREIQSKAQEVLKKRLPELCEAMRVDFSEMRDQIRMYAEPDELGEGWEGNWAWVAVRTRGRNDLISDCYFGMEIQKSEEEGTCVGKVSVTMTAKTEETLDQILSQIRSKAQELSEGIPQNTEQTDLALTDRISPETGGMASFEQKLDKLIGLWIRVWNAYYTGKDAMNR